MVETLNETIEKLRTAKRDLQSQVADFQSEVAGLVQAFREIEGKSQFVGFTYTSKGTGEIARYTLQIGVDYKGLVERSLLELELNEATHKAQPFGAEAFEAVQASLKESLLAMAEGREHKDYTKAGIYISICSGIRMNSNDLTLEVCGVQRSRVVIQKGEYKTVKSKSLTIVKNAIRDTLPLAKYRTLSLDIGAISSARINGETIDFD